MAARLFPFENDLLKHHVRTEAWLPLIKNRLEVVRAGVKPGKQSRRLKYFTFCAVGAIDVLMLDVARVIRRSTSGKFDTVVFFDRSPEDVLETQKRIPGALGFPGDFIKVILLEDLDEDYFIDGGDPLRAPELPLDKLRTREHQRLIAQRREFIRCFPFDVINLDLEEYLFKPTEQLPGKVTNALRRVFEWQQRPLPSGEFLDGFTLMFTTKIGPPNLTPEYLATMRGCLISNIMADESLRHLLIARAGNDDIDVLQRVNFDIFFKLAVPKILASALMEQDWFIVPETGIAMYEFERPHREGTYTMLHLAMDIKRKNPPLEQRPPGEEPAEAREAYRSVVRRIFSDREIIVAPHSINARILFRSLERIKARRRRYYPDEEALDI